MTSGKPSPETLRAIRDAQKMISSPEARAAVRNARAAAESTRSARLAWTETMTPIVERAVKATQDVVSRIDFKKIGDWIQRVGEALTRMLPTNLQKLEPRLWPQLTALARDEQLCLAWVPDLDTVRALLDADGALERERVLVDRADAVLDACDRSLDELEARASVANDIPDDPMRRPRLVGDVADLPGILDLLRDSIAAARNGLYRPAQALATCVTDSVMTQYLAPESKKKTHTYVKKTIQSSQEWQVFAVVLEDALVAFESCLRRNAKWSPTTEPPAGATEYSRNATVHAASTAVYTEATALKAILLATSIVMVASHPLVFRLLDLFNQPPAPAMNDGDDLG